MVGLPRAFQQRRKVNHKSFDQTGDRRGVRPCDRCAARSGLVWTYLWHHNVTIAANEFLFTASVTDQRGDQRYFSAIRNGRPTAQVVWSIGASALEATYACMCEQGV